MANPFKSSADASAIYHQQETLQALAKSAQGNMWRFRLKEQESAQITFIDGDLDAQGMIDSTYMQEHTIEVSPKEWKTFICTAHAEPCPLCAANHKPSFVCCLTVIDHRVFSRKDGTTGTDQPRLFIGKSKTMVMLRKLAQHMGGLKGARFDVSRSDGKSASVGDVFIPMGKLTAEEHLALRKKFIVRDENGKAVANPKTGKALCTVPADYPEEIPYYTAAELVSMGVCTAVKTIGKEAPLKESIPLMKAPVLDEAEEDMGL